MSPFRLFATLFALLSLVCAAALPAAAAPQYTLQDLGTLTPGGGAQPQGVNQAGQVFGHATPSTTNYSLPDHIFFWSPAGGMVDIGALPEVRPANSYPAEGWRTATAMNDQGQIVGASEVKASFSADGQFVTVSHAFLWTPALDDKSGTFQDLGTLTTDSQADIGTAAVAVNNHGQVIGTADARSLPMHGFLWTPDGTDGVPSNPQMKDLGRLVPSLLDDSGHVVGLLNGGLTMYDGQKLVSLGSPPGFVPSGLYSAYSLTVLRADARGDLYGIYSTPAIPSASFVWVPDHLGASTGHFITGPGTNTPVPGPGVLTAAQLPAGAQVFWASPSVFAFDPANEALVAVDLGGLVYDTIYEGNPAFPPFDTYPFARNAAGDLVGVCELPTGSPVAFLEQAGLMYDLNLHIQGPDAGVTQLWEGIAINDSGQIAALGQAAGQTGAPLRAVLLTPAGQAAPSAPTVQLIQPQPPDAGDPDQTVDIQGTGFQVGAVVTYDGAPLTATVYAETQIIAHIPAALLTAGTHTVTVTDPGGASGSGPYVVLPVRPVPSLSAVSPTTLPAGSPDATVTLTGTGLYPETQIGVGYVAPGQTFLAVLSVSEDHTRLTARLPAALLVYGGVLDFYAHTPGQRGTPQDVPAPALTVMNPAPTITAIDPPTLLADSVPFFTLTLTGTGFVADTSVIWNGRACSIISVSPTQVTAFVYASDGVVPGPVTVSAVNRTPGGGTATVTQTLTDGPNPAPVLAAVDPNSISAGQSSSDVMLTGAHFMHHSAVHFGGRVFYPDSLSDDRTQMSIYLPSASVPPVGVYPVTVVNPGPGGGTSAARNLVVGAAAFAGTAHARILWTNPDGRATLWFVNPDGSYGLIGAYGPYADAGGVWRAVAVATGPNGVSRLLWTNPDGRATLWFVNADGSYGVSGAYGPYADAGGVWRAAALSVGPDNVAHILWDNPDGRATLWFVNPDNSYGVLGAYGPYADGGGLWNAAALATGPNGVSRLLWNNPDGRATLWFVNPDGTYGVSGAYGPYADGGGVWRAGAVSVGPDNVAHILWTNPDGRATLWFVNVDASYGLVGAYGPYADGGGLWTAGALATGPDGVSRLLWTNPDGRATLWFVNPDTSYGVSGAYGPYADAGGLWRAVADSAGP